MKKFIISKIEHNEIAKRAAEAAASDNCPPAKISRNETVTSEIPPPLPLAPPPTDDLPNLNVVIKQEVEDLEYATAVEESLEAVREEKVDIYKPPRPICRDFIRGKCSRPGTCKYLHKHDISQLSGIYTFCREFQNSVCRRPNCKYVHATVFEEQRFYRTAELPPHTTAHFKNLYLMPPPPPPPPLLTASTCSSTLNIPTIFNTPPPPLPTRTNTPASAFSPIYSSYGFSGLSSPAVPPVLPPPVLPIPATPQIPAIPSTSRYDFTNIDPFGCSPRNHEVAQQSGSSCSSCDVLEQRLQYCKEMVEKKKQESKEMSIKLINLNQKKEKLYDVLVSLLKPSLPNSSTAKK